MSSQVLKVSLPNWICVAIPDQSFTLPAVSATNGLTLMGYTTSWTENNGIEMKDNETLIAVGAVVTPEADMNYYPRYRYRYVPTWTWNDADATATLSIKCSALSSESINVSDITYTTSGDVKTATGTYDHNGSTYTFTDTYLLPVGDLVLRNEASNEDNLDTYHGRKVNTLTLQGRMLYADGSWNTLCLPFSLNETEVYTYLNPSAEIESHDPDYVESADGKVQFKGTFDPETLDGGDASNLYLGAGNKLYYPSTDRTINAFRGYFHVDLDDVAPVPGGSGVRAFVLNFGDEEATGIISTTNLTNYTNSAGAGWYAIDGRKLSGKPTKKGVYIHNGNKVVIK